MPQPKAICAVVEVFTKLMSKINLLMYAKQCQTICRRKCVHFWMIFYKLYRNQLIKFSGTKNLPKMYIKRNDQKNQLLGSKK